MLEHGMRNMVGTAKELQDFLVEQEAATSGPGRSPMNLDGKFTPAGALSDFVIFNAGQNASHSFYLGFGPGGVVVRGSYGEDDRGCCVWSFHTLSPLPDGRINTGYIGH